VKSVESDFVYMIINCEVMTQCKSDVWINGLGSYYSLVPTNGNMLSQSAPKNFDLLVSCHECV